uniref:hypothetical protein n=1 Tax=Dyella sp. TaxID=1869338 RepID=UPI003217AD8F
QLNQVPDLTSALSIGTAVNGSIPLAGQSAVYSFHLAAATQLAFDALSSRGDMLWSLAGPRGQEVNSRSLNSSDGNSGQNVLALPAGDYTLTVQGSGDATGAFAFNLLDLSTAAALAQGAPLSGTLSPGNSSSAYQFTAAAGDSVAVHAASATGGSAVWRIVDMFGRTIGTGNLSGDSAAVSLANAGSYTLLIEGYVGNTAPVNFQARLDNTGNTAPAPLPAGDPLTLGSVTAGTLAAWNSTQTYRFTLGATTQLLLDAQQSGNTYWSLQGPRGTEFNTWVSNGDQILTLPAGDYALTLQGAPSSGYSAGAYAFSAVDLSTLPNLQLGQQTIAQRSPGSAAAGYRVEASAGQTLLLNADYISGYSPTWRLVGPQGQVLPAQSGDNIGTLFRVPADGTYTLLDLGYYYDSYATDRDTFTLSATDTTTTPLSFNDVAHATLAGRQSIAQYSFTLDHAQTVVPDFLAGANGNPSNLQWMLRSTAGTIVGWQWASYDQGTMQLLPPGQYTLLFRSSNDTPTDLSFRVLDRGIAQELQPGTPVQTTLVTDQTQLFRFNASAGDHFYLQSDPSAQTNNADWRILAPGGAVIASGSIYNGYDNADIAATYTGEYLLVVSPYVGNSAPKSQPLNFTLGLRSAQNAALTLGADTAGAITQPGQSIQYSFTLDAPTSVLMNTPVNNGSYLRWSLTGPRGPEVSQRDFSYSSQNLLDLPAGTYVLTVAYGDLSTGNFHFSLLNQAAMPALAADTPTTATLPAAGLPAPYRFDVAADGDFRLEGPQDGNSEQWQVQNAQGQVIASGNSNYDNATPFHLAAGSYVLSWQNAWNASTDAAVNFVLRHVVTTVQPLVPGTPATAAIATPGQRYAYDFALGAPGAVLFQSLAHRSDLSWQLQGPLGNVVSSAAMDGSGDLLLQLPAAGNYRLTVIPNGAATGAFAFNLFDFNGTAALSLGAAQTARIAPSGSSVLYAVQGAAGDYLAFHFDSIAGSGASARVFDASGNVVLNFGNVAAGQDLLFKLPHDGRYQLQLSGNGDGAETDIGYSAALTTPAHASLTLGTDVQGHSSVAGVPDSYAFAIAAPATVLVDGFGDAGQRWNIRAADGSLVQTGHAGTASACLLGPGTYTLEVLADDASQLGAYGVRIVDFASATDLAIGSSSVSAADSHALVYRLTAGVDQSAIQLAVSTAQGSGASIRVYDAGGRLVASGSGALAATSIAQSVAAGTQRYLVIDGAAADYTVTSSETQAPPAPPLAWGGSVNGSFNFVGDSASYRVTIGYAQTLAIANLLRDLGSHGVHWRLTPAGASSENPWSD